MKPTLMMASAMTLLLMAGAVRAEVVVHVSPTGDDRAPGTAERPVRTLVRAQALVRAANARDDVTVVVGDGVYTLTAPLVFRAADGGQGGHRVDWRAADGAKPLLSGGIPVTGFRLHDEARRIWVADVPKGVDARQLWVNDILAERPWIEIKASDVSFSATGFDVTAPELAYLSTLQRPDRLEVEATGFFTDRISPVKGIAGRTVTMQQPAWDNNSWGYDTLTKPIFPADSRLFLTNALEFIGKVTLGLDPQLDR